MGFPPAKEYIHVKSIGDLQEIRKKASEIKPYLENLYSKGDVIGITLLVIKNEQMKENKYIWHDVSSVTNNMFPFMYVALQFENDEGENEDISIWLKNNEFVDISDFD